MEGSKTNETISERAADQSPKAIQREANKTIEVELAAYLPMLDELEASEQEKLELLHSLYAIIRSFIDLGFRVDFSQQPCGQIEEKTGAALRSHIYSTHQELIENTQYAAAPSRDAAEEGVKA